MSRKNPGNKEGFWPFDNWFPDDPEAPGPSDKASGSTGDGPGSSSIKNYPSLDHASAGNEGKHEKETRKRVGRKKGS